jgi:hypothetical protein
MKQEMESKKGWREEKKNNGLFLLSSFQNVFLLVHEVSAKR